MTLLDQQAAEECDQPERNALRCFLEQLSGSRSAEDVFMQQMQVQLFPELQSSQGHLYRREDK